MNQTVISARTVFVGNLPAAQKSVLSSLLRKALHVEGDPPTVDVKRSKRGNKRLYAFIEFKKEESARKVLESGIAHILGEDVPLKGKSIHPSTLGVCNLWVGDIPEEFSFEEFSNLFSGFPHTSISQFHFSKKGVYAFVNFSEQATADKCCTYLSSLEYPKLVLKMQFSTNDEDSISTFPEIANIPHPRSASDPRLSKIHSINMLGHTGEQQLEKLHVILTTNSIKKGVRGLRRAKGSLACDIEGGITIFFALCSGATQIEVRVLKHALGLPPVRSFLWDVENHLVESDSIVGCLDALLDTGNCLKSICESALTGRPEKTVTVDICSRLLRSCMYSLPLASIKAQGENIIGLLISTIFFYPSLSSGIRIYLVLILDRIATVHQQFFQIGVKQRLMDIKAIDAPKILEMVENVTTQLESLISTTKGSTDFKVVLMRLKSSIESELLDVIKKDPLFLQQELNKVRISQQSAGHAYPHQQFGGFQQQQHQQQQQQQHQHMYNQQRIYGGGIPASLQQHQQHQQQTAQRMNPNQFVVQNSHRMGGNYGMQHQQQHQQPHQQQHQQPPFITRPSPFIQSNQMQHMTPLTTSTATVNDGTTYGIRLPYQGQPAQQQQHQQHHQQHQFGQSVLLQQQQQQHYQLQHQKHQQQQQQQETNNKKNDDDAAPQKANSLKPIHYNSLEKANNNNTNAKTNTTSSGLNNGNDLLLKKTTSSEDVYIYKTNSDSHQPQDNNNNDNGGLPLSNSPSVDQFNIANSSLCHTPTNSSVHSFDMNNIDGASKFLSQVFDTENKDLSLSPATAPRCHRLSINITDDDNYNERHDRHGASVSPLMSAYLSPHSIDDDNSNGGVFKRHQSFDVSMMKMRKQHNCSSSPASLLPIHEKFSIQNTFGSEHSLFIEGNGRGSLSSRNRQDAVLQSNNNKQQQHHQNRTLKVTQSDEFGNIREQPSSNTIENSGRMATSMSPSMVASTSFMGGSSLNGGNSLLINTTANNRRMNVLGDGDTNSPASVSSPAMLSTQKHNVNNFNNESTESMSSYLSFDGKDDEGLDQRKSFHGYPMQNQKQISQQKPKQKQSLLRKQEGIGSLESGFNHGKSFHTMPRFEFQN
eukprot:TRINITY_DN379_c0_g1_i1.p1 TRINITY_DN379_c0_g1~~TRINITY_DN379_c0_g1_i1.p1  ORF type:complete len:1099 (-),score=416.90 TRINITY_DN379_c0_g1_i1:550-3846(-)